MKRMDNIFLYFKQNFMVYTAWKWSVVCSPPSKALACLYSFLNSKSYDLTYTCVHKEKKKNQSSNNG